MSNLRRIFHSRSTAALVSALVTVVALGATNALAGHDANTIHACANEQTGSLRLVDSPSDCRPNETAVEWNKQGPAGPAGNLALAGQRCVQGQFVVGFAVDGSLLCETPSASGGGGGSVPADADGDGVTVADGDCNDNDTSIKPGAAELLDGKDNDCDGQVDEGVQGDADGDGVTVADGDCNDNDASIRAGATELFDGKDNDCDAQIDEGLSATVLNGTNSASEADYCSILHPPTLDLAPGQSALVSGRIYEAGSTEQPGPVPGYVAQLGVGPIESDPRSSPGWIYTTATYEREVANGSTDEYGAWLVAPSVTGMYSYVYRFGIDGGNGYTYCDLDGAGSLGGDFSPTNLGVLTSSG